MRTQVTLQPGQKGTKKLYDRYGDQLVCVRYRYDAARQRRLKTVELIVEEVPWRPERAARLRQSVGDPGAAFARAARVRSTASSRTCAGATTSG